MSPSTPIPRQREVDLENPWLGLDSFEERHELFFFGRSAEADELLLRISNQPLTLFYGRSGLGKTSILRAGLIPRLRKRGARPVLVRLKYPGRALAPDEAFPGPAAQILDALFPKVDRVELPGQGLPEDAASELWLRLHRMGAEPLFTHLIIDQAEEVFTLGATLPGADAELRDILAMLLEGGVPEALREPFAADRSLRKHYQLKAAPLPILLSLRHEYVYALNRWRRHLPGIGTNNLELGPLRGPAALDAVFEPGALRMAYVRQPDGQFVEQDASPRPIISIEVARRLVRRLAKASDTAPLEEITAVPPLLSVVCQELNATRLRGSASAETISKSQVAGTGDQADPDQILRRYYEESFLGRPKAVQMVVEDELLSGDGYRQPRTPKFLIQKLVKKGLSAADAERHLHELENRRLLSTNQLEAESRYELTHDVLGPIVAESKARRKGRQEAARKATLFTVGSVVLLAISALYVAWNQTKIAKQQAELTVKESTLRRNSELTLAGLYLRDVDDLASADKIATALHAVGKAAASDPQTNTMLLDLLLRTNWMLPLCKLQTTEKISFANFNQAGDVAVTVSRDRLATLWSIPSGARLQTLTHGGAVLSAEFSPDGEYLVTATENKEAVLWKKNGNGSMVQAARLGHDNAVNSARFSPKGTLIVTACKDNTAKLWKVSAPGQGIELSHKVPLPKDVVPTPDPAASPWNSGAGFSWPAAPGSQPQPGAPAAAVPAPPGSAPAPASAAVPAPPAPAYEVVDARISPDETLVATASQDGTVRIWDVASGKVTQSLQHGGGVTDLRFSPDGFSLVTASEDGKARIWTVALPPPQGRPSTYTEYDRRNQYFAHTSKVNTAAFDRTGRYVVTSSQDQTAQIWSRYGYSVLTLRHNAAVQSATFSPTAPIVMTVAGRNAQLWQAGSACGYALPMSHDEPIRYAEFSADGTRAITTVADGKHATVWDVRLATSLPTVFAPIPGVRAVSFDAAGKRVAAATTDGLLVCDRDPRSVRAVKRFYELPKPVPVATPMPTPVPSATPAPEPAGAQLVPQNGAAVQASAVDPRYIAPPPPRPIPPQYAFVNLSRSGEFLATVPEASQGGKPPATVVQVWELNKKDAPPVLLDHPEAVYFAKFSGDGSKLLTLSKRGGNLWDWRKKAPTALPAVSNSAFWADINGDGSRVAFGVGSTGYVYEMPAGRMVGQPLQARGAIFTLRFHPAGDKIVMAGGDNAATIWDLVTGATVQLKHKQPVRCVDFSPDGARLVTATANEVMIWDWKSQFPLTAPVAPAGTTHLEAQFDSSGQRVLLASASGPIYSWDLGNPNMTLPSEVLHVGEALAGGSFKDESGREKSLESLVELKAPHVPEERLSTEGARLAEWLLLPRGQRTISPFSDVKAADYIHDLLQSKLYMGFVLQAYQLDPTNRELQKAYTPEKVFDYVGSNYYRQPLLGFGSELYAFSSWRSDVWNGPMWSSTTTYWPAAPRPSGGR